MLDQRIEGAHSGGGSDVQLVDHCRFERDAAPVAIRPCERCWIDYLRDAVNSGGLGARGWVGARVA
jgi:hypothetical protein